MTSLKLSLKNFTILRFLYGTFLKTDINPKDEFLIRLSSQKTFFNGRGEGERVKNYKSMLRGFGFKKWGSDFHKKLIKKGSTRIVSPF